MQCDEGRGNVATLTLILTWDRLLLLAIHSTIVQELYFNNAAKLINGENII